MARTIEVLCENYTGAHFRGIPDDADSKMCKLTLIGEDPQVIGYLLDNLSYGSTDHETITWDQFLNSYKEGAIPAFDGCGGIFEIRENGNVVVDVKEDYCYGGGENDHDELLEFTVDLSTVRTTDRGYDWHLNHLIEQRLKIKR